MVFSGVKKQQLPLILWCYDNIVIEVYTHKDLSEYDLSKVVAKYYQSPPKLVLLRPVSPFVCSTWDFISMKALVSDDEATEMDVDI